MTDAGRTSEPTVDEPLLVTHEAGVATVTLHRPRVLNALDQGLLERLRAAFDALAARDDLRCVILQGAGKAFAAGADLAAMANMEPAQARALADTGRALTLAMEALPVPVIAAVHGHALGGGLELALAADFIHAAAGTRLGFPEVGVGVIPGLGGTQRLAARVGVARARELVFTGRQLDAAEAAAIGLVNAVHPPEALSSSVRALAAQVAGRAPLAVRAAKQALAAALVLPWPAGLAREAELFAGLFGTADQREGMGAFLAKRAPVFRGR